MEHVKERYVDGIGKIHFIGGVVRFDLYSFQPTGEENQTPEKINNQLNRKNIQRPGPPFTRC